MVCKRLLRLCIGFRKKSVHRYTKRSRKPWKQQNIGVAAARFP